jgi:dTDP-glucose pyrophosphorylase
MQSVDPDASLTEEQRRAADAGLKAMMPVGGRPFLDFVLSAIADAGIRHVAIVVAPGHDELRRYYGITAPPARIGLDFVVQPEALGTANAVLAAEPWVRHDPFIVMNGDNLYPAAVLRSIAALDEPGLPGFHRDELVRSSNIEAARVTAFAVVETDGEGYLKDIVEKPSADLVERRGPHAIVSMNCWRFDRRIFQACRDVPRSPRGEFELPAAVSLALERGVRFRIVPAGGAVLDLSQRADAAEVTRRLAGIVPRP